MPVLFHSTPADAGQDNLGASARVDKACDCRTEGAYADPKGRNLVYDIENLLPLFDRFLSPDATQYVLCIYKGFNALTNLEYVLHFPNNSGEMIFCIVVMVIAVWLEGSILGTLLYYMVDNDPVALAHKRQMEELHEFIESKHLPPDLSNRVVRHFEFQYQKAVENRASASVQLPRSLAIKVSNCKYRGALDKCTGRGEIFYGCSPQFLNALVMKLNLVFYMPNEEIFKKDDLSRQLGLVERGACYIMEDDKVKRIVRDDVPNIAPILGELAFFLGILQPMTVRARPDGDVQLLVISREDSNELFSNYPEQLEIICKNILNSFGMDEKGNPLSQGIQEEDDAEKAALKAAIKTSMSRQHDETFASLAFAAKAGDVEMVRQLLRRGAEIDDVDYDGRSVLAMACFEGSYKVVELLLEEGSDKNTKNRWGQTPLQEAMENRQGPVVELLSQWKASLDPDQAAGALCDAASCGDIEKLKKLVDNKIDPNQGDYDLRTAMHVAAAEGHAKVVEFLISSKANVNLQDRWGGTPLQDAVSLGHVQVATMLRAKGGTMPESLGAMQVCDAAAKGDVQTLRLLVECAGIQTSMGDYDSRCPMHLAAAEARILAVSYLLGISADPSILDRWGNTPLDEALRGGTLYHMYCARLIHGWGGRLGTLKGKTEGKQLLAEMKQVSIDDVRKLINHLIAKGYDKKIPERKSEQDILVSYEASSELVMVIQSTKILLQDTCEFIDSKSDALRALVQEFRCHLQPYLIITSSSKTPRRTDSSVGDFDSLLQSLDNADNESDDVFDDDCGYLDSDEEAKLYDELDNLMEAQERAYAFKGNANKFMANAFQKIFLRVQDLEDSFDLICRVFQKTGEEGRLPYIDSAADLQNPLNLLSITGFTQFELEDMLEEGHNCMELCSNIFAHEKFGNLKMLDENDDNEPSTHVSLIALLAGSNSFRQSLQKLQTDPIYCAIMLSSLAAFVPSSQIRHLAQDGKEIEITRIGSVVYASRQAKTCTWFILLSGRLRVSLDELSQTDEDEVHFELNPGDVFGGYGFQPDIAEVMHVKVETVQGSRFIELSDERLTEFVNQEPEAGAKLLARMAESTWNYLSVVRPQQESTSLVAIRDRIRRRSVIVDQNSALAFEDWNGKGKQPCSEIELHAIKTGIIAIDSLWRDISMGTDHVSSNLLVTIHKELGEIGSELFRRIFLNKVLPVQISKKEFWACLLNFLAEELFLQGQISVSEFITDDLPEVNGEAKENGSRSPTIELESEDGWEEDPNCFEMIHSRFAPSRRLKDGFFDEDIADRYESAFLIVAGDLKKPISWKQIPEFLENLFPSFPFRFSPYNVKETMRTFGRDGARSKVLFWSDIRKGLRENKRGQGSLSSKIFVRSVFNPESSIIKHWRSLMVFVAIYHFIVVPIRISFVPWSSMLDSRALYTDLIADGLTLFNLIVHANTAYLNSRATWVTKRYKIIRRIDFRCSVGAIPFDWFAFACGGSIELCNWLRMPKLLVSFKILLGGKQKASMESKGSSSRRKLIHLAYVVFSVVHVCACLWFFIGSNYKEWFPGRGVSWYTAEESLKNISFTDHHKFGMHESSTVWEQYLLSFYWVAATLTCNGLIGDVIPQNVVEIVFCIIFMILNLTLFRYVTGEVSTLVMKSDEETVELRSRLEAVETLLQDSRIGKDLQEEIRLHFRTSQSNRGVDQTALFSKLSQSLQVEVASCIAREYLDNVPLFQGCSEKMLDSISVLLREIQFAPEEYLYRAGETANEMFFVVSGSVDELSENAEGGDMQHGKIERTVHSGKGTGELSFFFGMRHLASARAHKSTGSVCLRLPREQFLPLLKMFPDDEENIAQAALSTFEVVKSQAGSHRSGSVHSAGQKSKSAMSSHSRASSLSRRSRGSSAKGGPGCSHSSGGNPEEDEDSADSEEAMDTIVGWGMKQKIEALKMRRRADRITVILTAASRGDLAGMKQALRKESGVNSHDVFLRTPLHVAASEGQVEVVRFLIQNTADVNAKDKFNNSSLNDAVRHRHDQVAALLRESGACLHLHGNQAGVLMCQASFAGNAEEVKRLIENGVATNAADYDGRTALHLASSEGYQEIVEYLLLHKADVQCRDRFKGSPLDDAVRHGYSLVQKLLREHGASLDAAACALKMCDAAARGDVEKIKVYVENGVDCSVGDYDQRTAAHLAASNGRISVLDFLLSQEKKVEINAVDRMGGTPMEDAKRHGEEIAAVLLERHGGLLASDPKLIELKKQQALVLKREQKAYRKPLVQSHVASSPEKSGHIFIQDSLLPSLHTVLNDLQSQAQLLRSAIERAAPILHQVFPSSSSTPRQPELLKQNREAVDNLVTRISAFGIAASSALESLNTDFPRNRAIRFAARGYFMKAGALKRLIKVCAEIMKMTKKPLKEMKSILRPRGVSIFGSTSRSSSLG